MAGSRTVSQKAQDAQNTQRTQSTQNSRTRKKGASAKSAGRSRSSAVRRSRSSFTRLLLDLLLMSWLGRVFLVSLIMAVVLGLNILISKNQYDLFFILTGIELAVTALVFWLRLVLRRS